MTRYDDFMNREHVSWCPFPTASCTCPTNPSKEREFTVNLLISVNGFGLTGEHRSNIISKVNRELRLAFGGNLVQVAEVERDEGAPYPLWVQTTEVESTEVHQVDEAEEVPRMQGNGSSTTRTGL